MERYRCKVKNAEVYNKLMVLYESYLTEDALKILNQRFSKKKRGNEQECECVRT